MMSLSDKENVQIRDGTRGWDGQRIALIPPLTLFAGI